MRAAFTILTEPEIGRLQEYLGPMLSSTAVDTFCQHWPEESKAKLRADFYTDLNTSEEEYSQCRVAPSVPQELRVKALLAELLETLANQVAPRLGRAASAESDIELLNLMMPSLLEFDVQEPLQRFKRDSVKLPPYAELK